MRLSVTIVLLLAVAAFCDIPVFQDPVQINCAGEPITQIFGHLNPWMGDWNADGKPDLILGCFVGSAGGQSANVALYENESDTDIPVFNTFEWMQGGGEYIHMCAG